MAEPREARDQDVETIVVQKFQEHLGISDDLPLSSGLYTDLGLDSIMFVVILTDITEQLRLDLRATQVDLKEIKSLEEVVSLVSSLQADDGNRVA